MLYAKPITAADDSSTCNDQQRVSSPARPLFSYRARRAPTRDAVEVETGSEARDNGRNAGADAADGGDVVEVEPKVAEPVRPLGAAEVGARRPHC